jgi:hypothetical protein
MAAGNGVIKKTSDEEASRIFAEGQLLGILKEVEVNAKERVKLDFGVWKCAAELAVTGHKVRAQELAQL